MNWDRIEGNWKQFKGKARTLPDLDAVAEVQKAG